MNNDKDYVDKLIEALKHPEPTTRVRAAWVLGRKKEKRAVTPLIEAINNNLNDPYILESIVGALGLTGDSSALDEIFSLLKSSYLIVRIQAARAISMIGDRKGVDPLMAALKDENTAVRKAAAEALGRMIKRELACKKDYFSLKG